VYLHGTIQNNRNGQIGKALIFAVVLISHPDSSAKKSKTSLRFALLEHASDCKLNCGKVVYNLCGLWTSLDPTHRALRSVQFKKNSSTPRSTEIGLSWTTQALPVTVNKLSFLVKAHILQIYQLYFNNLSSSQLLSRQYSRSYGYFVSRCRCVLSSGTRTFSFFCLLSSLLQESCH